MNDSELLIITISDGTKVYLKQTLTYGDELMVESYKDELIKYDYETQKPLPIPLAALKAGSKKAFELLLIKVVFTDGTTAPDPMKAILAMSGADGRMVKEKADEIYSQVKLGKKNGNS